MGNSPNIHRFAVYLSVPSNLEACGNELRGRLHRAGLPVRLHPGPELSEHYRDARRIWLFELGCVVAATLVVIMALFAGTASISRIERRREFAMLRALGLSQRSLFVHVVAEAVMISLSAVALGLLATSLIAWTARLAGWRVPVELNPAHQVGAIALVLAAVLAAVLVPALKAARDDITQGLAGGEQ
jgi:putative ABC transport system permease protein